MKQLPALLSLVFLFAFALVPDSSLHNEITGKITMSSCPDYVMRGNGYNKDGTDIMHSDDPLARPERNVIVSLHPLDFTPALTPTENAYITQVEQTFLPHVLPVVVGSKVHFLNEDEFFHNVQSYSRGASFSIGRRAPGISYSVKIKKQGVIHLMCDIHSHMDARILSFDTPYFTRVNEDGRYSVKNLPDGRYRLEVFHPNCENLNEEVSVKGGKVFEFDYQLGNRP